MVQDDAQINEDVDLDDDTQINEGSNEFSMVWLVCRWLLMSYSNLASDTSIDGPNDIMQQMDEEQSMEQSL